MKDNKKYHLDFIDKQINNKSGFTTPESYFNDFENNFNEKKLKTLIPNENGFIIPDNYFQTFEENLNLKETKVFTLKNKINNYYPWLVAASLTLFLFLKVMFFNTDKRLDFDTLSENDLEYWINNNDMNETDIAIIFKDNIESEDDFTFSSLENEKIENYFNPNEIELILNELN